MSTDAKTVFLRSALAEAREALESLPWREESVKFFHARLALLEHRLATWEADPLQSGWRVALLNDAITLLLAVEDVGEKLGFGVDGPASVDRALARVAQQ